MRGAWLFLASGIVLYQVGNLVYLFHDQNLNPIPNPAPSDVFYLAEYAALAIGVVLFTQRNFGAVRVSTRLDGAITGLAIAATAGLFWFGHVLDVSGRPLQVIVGMAYPVMDLVLLVLLISAFAPARYRPAPAVVLLMLGMTAFVVGDVIYLNQVASNTYVQGTPLDASWVIGLWLIGLAAWPRNEDSPFPPTQLGRPGRDRAGAHRVRRSCRSGPRGLTRAPHVAPVTSLLAMVALGWSSSAWP